MDRKAEKQGGFYNFVFRQSKKYEFVEFVSVLKTSIFFCNLFIFNKIESLSRNLLILARGLRM
jgi:hypothetical protein